MHNNLQDMVGVVQVVERRIYYYNDIRRHESLGNISPTCRLLKKNRG